MAPLILLVVRAWAADPAVLVLPASGGPDEASLERAAEGADLRLVRTAGAGAFVRGVHHLAMPRELGADCAGPVALDEWRARMAAAQRRFDLFDTEGSLSDFLSIELDLQCTAAPVPARDLHTLGLAIAEAHLLLSGASAEVDDESEAFHRKQAEAALAFAVAAAPDRYPEAASPELVDALEAAQARHDASAGPWLAVVGVDRGEEAWINGSRVAQVARVPAGDSVVLRVVDGEVVGARKVHLAAGEGAVVDFTGDATPLGELVADLVRSAPSRLEQEQLAALALLRGEGDTVLFAGWDRGRPVAWQAVGRDLVKLDVPAEVREPERAEPEPPPRPKEPRESTPTERRPREVDDPAVDRWRATAGVLLGGGYRLDHGGLLDLALAGRVAVASEWAVAWSVGVAGDAASFDPAGGGVEADVPLRVGVRWGRHERAGHPEAGLDLGARVGRAVEPLLGACGAWAGGAGPAGGVRLDVCAETDFAGLTLRGGLTFESWI